MSFFFQDASGVVKGPLPVCALVRLLLKANSLVSKDTLVSADKNAWSLISSLETIQPVLRQLDATWHYVDIENAAKGPYSTNGLVNFMDNGDIDGMTMVWSKGFSNWQKLIDVNDLKEIMQILQAIDDDDEKNDDDAVSKLVPDVDHKTVSSSSLKRKREPETSDKNKNHHHHHKQTQEEEEEEEDDAYWIKITNLPINISISELSNHFKPVGIIQLNPIDLSQPLIVIDATNAYLAFHYAESRTTAIDYLNNSQIRLGQIVQVSAPNEDELKLLKSTYSTSSSSRNSSSKLIMRSLTSWNDDDDDNEVGLRIVDTLSSYSSQADVLNEVNSFGPVSKIVELNDGHYRLHFQNISSATDCVFSNGDKFKYYDKDDDKTTADDDDCN